MKKLLEIQMREDGVGMIACNLDNETDAIRLAASLIAAATKNPQIGAVLKTVIAVITRDPEEAELLTQQSIHSGIARIFSGPMKKEGN